MIRSLRENARALASDVLRDVMWPVLAVLVLSHLVAACGMLCLLRCGAAALRVASRAAALRVASRAAALRVARQARSAASASQAYAGRV